jgi:hypothetical protein
MRTLFFVNTAACITRTIPLIVILAYTVASGIGITAYPRKRRLGYQLQDVRVRQAELRISGMHIPYAIVQRKIFGMRLAVFADRAQRLKRVAIA